MGRRQPKIRVRQPRIVQPGSRARLRLAVLLLVLVAVWSWWVFDYGRARGGFDSSQAWGMRNELRGQIGELRRERDELRLQVAQLESSSSVDRDATVSAQDEIKRLQAQTAKLRRELAFLRGVLAEGGSQGPLRVQNFRLISTAEQGRFRFRFIVTQVVKKVPRAEGEIRLAVSGLLEGATKTLDLAQLTGGKIKRLNMGFQNFQTLDGELRLPAGFEPEILTVEIRPKNKELRDLTLVMDWAVEEGAG